MAFPHSLSHFWRKFKNWRTSGAVVFLNRIFYSDFIKSEKKTKDHELTEKKKLKFHLFEDVNFQIDFISVKIYCQDMLKILNENFSKLFLKSGPVSRVSKISRNGSHSVIIGNACGVNEPINQTRVAAITVLLVFFCHVSIALLQTSTNVASSVSGFLIHLFLAAVSSPAHFYKYLKFCRCDSAATVFDHPLSSPTRFA